MSDLSSESQNKKQRLGRGLGSLLGGQPEGGLHTATTSTQEVDKPALTTTGATAQVPPESRIWKVAVDKIKPGVYQPRSHFDKDKLQELSQSIKENGILQPLVLRKSPNGSYEIIAGERRWRAAQMAGQHEVPAIIKNMDDKTTLQMSLIENIQREDLNPIEEAEAYSRLMEEFSLTQQQVAEKVGKERATVANSLRLLGLAPAVREMLVKKEISQGHAKVLLAVTDSQRQTELARRAVKANLSVRKLEKLVSSKKEKASFEEFSPAGVLSDDNIKSRLVSGLSEELQKTLGTKVTIDYSDSKGKISVHFYSDDELSDIVEKIKEAWQKA